LEPIVALAQEPPQPSGPASFEGLDRSLEAGNLTEAVEDLKRLAINAGQAQAELGTAAEEILRRAIETARGRLNEPAAPRNAQDEQSARQVLCLARAYFQEELPSQDGSPEPMTVGDDVARPEIVGQLKPGYTPEARRAGVAGTVIMKLRIDREGCVRQAQTLKGLPFGLADAAVAAVRHWTFKPATYQNRPVAVDYVVTVNFQPGKTQEPVGRQEAPSPSGSR
jgi:TonB family protein